MDRRGRIELQVGAFAVALLVAVGILVAMMGRSWTDRGQQYELLFGYLNDLKPSATVRYAGGVVVGRVVEFGIEDHLASVIVEVGDDVLVGPDTIFRIATSGLLGEKSVEIVNPKPVEDPLPEGVQIRGHDPVNIDLALADVGDMIGLLRTGLVGPDRTGRDFENSPVVGILGELQNLIAGVNTVLKTKDSELSVAIDDARGFVEQASDFMLTLNTTTQTAQQVIEAVEPERIRGLIQGIGGTVVDLRRTVRRLETDVSGLLGNVNTAVVGADDSLQSLTGNLQLVLSDVNGSVRRLERSVTGILDVGQREVDFMFNDPQDGLHQIRRNVGNIVATVDALAPGLAAGAADQLNQTFAQINTITANLNTLLEDVAGGLEANQDVLPSFAELGQLVENLVFLTNALVESPLFSEATARPLEQ